MPEILKSVRYNIGLCQIKSMFGKQKFMGFSSENEKNLIAREILPPCTGKNMESVERAEKSDSLCHEQIL